ncbi:pentatricopeptide repeat-containing protein [Prunus yedoensis var. nudiflora]|uniref:Pentatricopeptide repeat-containing protein n=1 Tax=Prunus yedoensis var. nudiflora TaxID=2094558 RepID=A0A314Y0P4_PRUYE|nr:pentatricopeptide repeat-containing protein [Prunus yedoensis var. nudiflora]
MLLPFLQRSVLKLPHSASLMRWPTNAALASLPNRHLRSLIRACTRQCSIDMGKKLHAAIITGRLASMPDSFLHNALLHFYAAHGSACSARKLFDEIPNSYKDAVDWTVLMGCFSRHGMPKVGFVCLSK